VFTEAAHCADKVREPVLTIYARVGVGDAWRGAGELATSEQVLEATLKTASTQGSEFQVALAQVALSGLRLSQNQPEAARRLLAHALPVLERTQSHRDVGRARFNLAHAALLQGKSRDALQQLRALAQLGATLGETQFLVSQAENARRVLDYALAHRSGVAYYRELAAKIGTTPQTLPGPIAPMQAGLPELELYTFGEARALLDGELITASEWQTATTKELFFFFATNPQGWRKEQILEELWPEASRSQANDLFHASMYRLRRALFPEAIIFREGVYRLNPEAVRWLDAQEFEQERAAAVQLSDPHAQIELLERVVALYRGEFLSEFYGDWCMLRREELRTHYLDALTLLGRAWQGIGNYRRAEQVYLKTLERDPAREETYRDLMALYAARGNRAEIIQTYRQCVEQLQAEVGMPPLPETVELYRRLLSES
jgi:DNA-binding SARP family transcriptional activator